MTGRIIALDLSSACTGIAYDGPDGARPVSSSYRLPRAGAAGDYGLGYAAFRAYLACRVERAKPVLIAFEAPLQVIGAHASSRRTNQATVRILFGLAAITEEVAGAFGIACAEVNIATIKKHFAGHGRADKRDIIARCRQLGWEPRNDNEADAMALWAYAKALREPGWSPRATPLFGRAATS